MLVIEAEVVLNKRLMLPVWTDKQDDLQLTSGHTFFVPGTKQNTGNEIPDSGSNQVRE